MTEFFILIVDDHPFIVSAYVNLLSINLSNKIEYKFLTAFNCQEAIDKINKQKLIGQPIGLAILDVSVPPIIEQKIKDGVDIALYIRKNFRDCKILMQSMHNLPIIVDQIIQQIKPEGFISKNDIDFEVFPEICQNIIKGNFYKSATIVNSIKELANHQLNLDIIDNKILILLSQGIKTQNLPLHIPLSLSAIEKRKTTMKDKVFHKIANEVDLLRIFKTLNLI